MHRVLLAAIVAFGFQAGDAAAAPQILGLVATADTPTELRCHDGMCSAEFSAICLEQGRDAPTNDTPYWAVDGAALTFVLTGSDGVERRLPASGVTIRSARSYAAVTIRIPEATMHSLGGKRVALDVGQGVALIPVERPGDLEPHTAQEVAAAADAFRNVGQATLADGSPLAHAYHAMMAMINALPDNSNRLTDMKESQLARETLTGVRMSAEARSFTEERLEFCENLTSGAWYAGGLRPCLQQQHDAFITSKNHDYWNAADAGS